MREQTSVDAWTYTSRSSPNTIFRHTKELAGQSVIEFDFDFLCRRASNEV